MGIKRKKGVIIRLCKMLNRGLKKMNNKKIKIKKGIK
jgi:hypothetical protein